MHYYKLTVFISPPDCLLGIGGGVLVDHLAVNNLSLSSAISAVPFFSTSLKVCKVQIKFILYLLRTADALKLPLLSLSFRCVSSAPGRFTIVRSLHVSFWHEFRTQSSVYPNFLSICFASKSGLDRKVSFFFLYVDSCSNLCDS